ncbi:unnamed protein product, partial [Choristocarpus tenellus]
FLWKGENYILKMRDDIAFLDNISPISRWLGFRVEGNPFFLTPSGPGV